MASTFKLLGTVAMIAAPGLWIETYFYSQAMHNTSLTGLSDLIYMLGWSCSIIGLIKFKAAGPKKLGSGVLYAQLFLLCVANVWNIWTIIDPQTTNGLYKILDWFWPISNCFMIFTGIAIIRANVLKGFWKYTALIAGLWLGVTAGSGMLLQGNAVSFYIMTVYSFVSFFLLGLTVFVLKGSESQLLRKPVLLAGTF